jgi:aminoglycoside phosphotransferase (APT) family kinase protein
MSFMRDVEALVPRDGIVRYLDETFGARPDPVEISRLGEGHSNLTFLLRRGADEWVLRRPPRGDILPGTHEMHREFAVMSAIEQSGSGVPVPPQLALCEDPSYIGTPFFLMGRVDGVVVRDRMPDPFVVPRHRRRLGIALAETLGDIHCVDWRAIGLDVFARKPDEFLRRNVARMQQLYDVVRHRDVREIDEAGAWLREHMPEQVASTLTHGDYKLDNVMFAPSLPPRIAAVVDWEISTIGDPMVDLGWMLYFSPQQGDPAYGYADANVTQLDGYPTRAELADVYAARSGRSIAAVRYYVALAGWKIAIIMEGSNMRFKQGHSDDAMFALLDEAVPMLAKRALDVIAGEVAVA